MTNPMHAEQQSLNLPEQRHLAEVIRAACIQAALEGYQDASMSGLCHEGAWEMAIDAMRALDVAAVLQENQNCRASR